MEDRDRPRRDRSFSGDRDHNSSSFLRLLCRPGAGSASRGNFRPRETARAPEHGWLQRNRCGGNAGQYAARGGILDVYSPEADRPVRVDFSGMKSSRCASSTRQVSDLRTVDDSVALPLTETPVTSELLGAINARLSGKRITGAPEILEQAMRDSGAGVFSGVGSSMLRWRAPTAAFSGCFRKRG